MIYQTDKIIIKPTISGHLNTVIEIERSHSNFIGQYDINQHQTIISDFNTEHFSIFEKSSGVLVGFIILAGIHDPNQVIELRRIAVTHQGLGYGRDALVIIKKLSFDLYKAHRLWLDVYEDNHKAIKLYETMGFKKEGLLRDCIKHNDSYRSMWIMSILSSEL